MAGVHNKSIACHLLSNHRACQLMQTGEAEHTHIRKVLGHDVEIMPESCPVCACVCECHNVPIPFELTEKAYHNGH